ncbi:flagellar biosynthesis protein FlhF [Bacillus sp. ISL-35]|uniref:flagellar biosynthesis protein FlhF n=1 Tax=Bacillus sp. ISL-35 TaxID=2819122 RepID=UPI001BE6158E|nr:flagellar biosynthesis protein FlhF [Bacillus sp. ISL-35]MBT2681371.1 flagellar biosynthesis protein FlhF [Bacillus sp. ISL-35]MBT2701838.1 flagellar biosynthesis protein FlhF [Chryseobacterium sp. ISL-80]
MKVKKYTASSMPEAMKQVRSELGSDAVILNSRVVQTGGFMGFFKKNSIEVIAAIDPDTEIASKPVNLDKSLKYNTSSKKTEEPKAEQTFYKKGTELTAPSMADKDLLKEISQLKDMLKSSGSTEGISLPDPVSRHLQHLRDQDVDQSIIDELSGVILEKWYLNGAAASEGEVAEWSAQAIRQRLSGLSFGGVSFTKKFVNVIGPTGVGKTTTLAKIAAECVLKHQKKVAFITTDTYRIAAIEQLKTYAKILNVPIEVCYNMDDYKAATGKFAQYDVVFIDTAGRNFRNQKYVNDLNDVIDFSEEMETFLVLALTSKQKDMEEIRNQFSLIHIDKFIFTKLDETSVYGSMLNMAEKFSTGIAYLTNGQDVPDDLIGASPEITANTIIGVNHYE